MKPIDRLEVHEQGTELKEGGMDLPPVTDLTPAPVDNVKIDTEPQTKRNKFTANDFIHIIFFSGSIIAFYLSVNYFRKRRDVLLNWQKDANDELITIKGKIKSLEDKVGKAKKQPNEV